MTGSMGRTSLAEGLPRVTPPCCLQSATRGERSTRWCTRAPPSPMPSRISGASSSGNERSMSTSTGRPEKGKKKGKAPKVWQTQWEPKKGGKGAWRLGPTRSKPKNKGGKGKSPNSPLSSMAGPLGFQESQRGGVLQRSSPPQQVLGIVRPFLKVMPPHRSMRHRHALTGGHSGCHRPRSFPGHQCESAHRGGEPAPPEPQRMADRAGEARTASDGGGLLQGATGPGSPSTEEEERSQPGTPEGRKHPFPPHPPRQWEDPHRETQKEVKIRPARGVSRAGRTARASIKPGTDTRNP